MVKHAASNHFQTLRYLVGARLESFDDVESAPLDSRFVSKVLTYARIAAATPMLRAATALWQLSPLPTIPRSRPEIVVKLTKVTPAESHFMPEVFACGGSGAPRAMSSMAPKAHYF